MAIGSTLVDPALALSARELQPLPLPVSAQRACDPASPTAVDYKGSGRAVRQEDADAEVQEAVESPLRPDRLSFAQRAIESAYAQHFDTIRLYAERRLRDRDTALEITQDVYVELIRASGRIDLSRPLLPWLLVVAQRRVADEVDARRRARECLEEAGRRLGQSSELITPLALDILRAIPEHQRSVVFRRVMLDQDYSAIARDVGRSSGACRNCYSRALSALRETLR